MLGNPLSVAAINPVLICGHQALILSGLTGLEWWRMKRIN
jgi:hypothetical protein